MGLREERGGRVLQVRRDRRGQERFPAQDRAPALLARSDEEVGDRNAGEQRGNAKTISTGAPPPPRVQRARPLHRGVVGVEAWIHRDPVGGEVRAEGGGGGPRSIERGELR